MTKRQAKIVRTAEAEALEIAMGRATETETIETFAPANGRARALWIRTLRGAVSMLSGTCGEPSCSGQCAHTAGMAVSE